MTLGVLPIVCVCVFCRHRTSKTQTSASISILAAKGGAEGGSLWLLDVCSEGERMLKAAININLTTTTLAPSHRVGG